MPTYPTHYRPEPQHGPVEEGRRLATFPRNKGAEELRVNLCAYNGFHYLAIRLWVRGEDGTWYPTKKGTSVRMAECSELAEVLGNVARQHESARLAGPDRGRGTDRGPVGEGNYLGRRRDAPQSRGTSTWGGGSPRQPQRSLPGPTGGTKVVERIPQPSEADPPFEPTKPTRPFTEFADD
jgi:hypothetical protein